MNPKLLLAGLLGLVQGDIDIKRDTNIDGPPLDTYLKPSRRSHDGRSRASRMQLKRSRWKMEKQSRKVNYQRNGTRG